MKIFVINLKRREDRLSQITADLANHGLTFERIEAIDAAANPEIAQYRRTLAAKIYSPNTLGLGFIGNFLSHQKIWARMVSENIGQALILEDDAVISSWDERFLKVDVAEMGYDFLRLGANHDPAIDPPHRVRNTGNKLHDRSIYTGQLWGNVAQIVTLNAAKTCLKAQPYWFPSDHYSVYQDVFGLRSAIVSPLVWSASGSQSDVPQTGKPAAENLLQRKFRTLKNRFRRRFMVPMLIVILRRRFLRHGHD